MRRGKDDGGGTVAPLEFGALGLKVFGAMSGALEEGDRVEIRGFGSFEVRTYDAYTGRNPKTGAVVDVAAKRAPFFKTGKELRLRINNKI